jgi:hypothetical protein
MKKVNFDAEYLNNLQLAGVKALALFFIFDFAAFIMANILNKGREPNKFDKELNEKNILVHAINCLKGSSGETIYVMFPGIFNEGDV